MGAQSKIEWTHHTFNPWWGCEKVSPGCAHCYAETFSKRTGHTIWGKAAPRRFFGDKHWNEPVKWNALAEVTGQRQRVFCASMADWLEDREDLIEPRTNLLELVHATPQLDWLLLSKRPENWQRLVSASFDFAMRHGDPENERQMNFTDWLGGWCHAHLLPDNVWIGTTVEDQTRADERIPELLRIPAKVRFLSCEPLLGQVGIEDFLPWIADVQARGLPEPLASALASVTDVTGIDWVIAGGESGPGASPMHPDWARSLRDQCLAAGVAFHFKQWGEWMPAEILSGTQFSISTPSAVHSPKKPAFHHWTDVFQGDKNISARVGKLAAGRELDGQTWDELPR